MAAGDQGAEPTTWELLRALESFKVDIKADIADVRADVSLLGGKVVSVELYNADKLGNTERHERTESRVVSLETSRKSDEQAAAEAEKLKQRQRVTIALGVLSPIVAALAILINVLVHP